MPEPTAPLSEDALIQLCSQKLGQINAIDQNTANNNRQNQNMATQRSELLADVNAIKAAIKSGAPWPPPPPPPAPAMG